MFIEIFGPSYWDLRSDGNTKCVFIIIWDFLRGKKVVCSKGGLLHWLFLELIFLILPLH